MTDRHSPQRAEAPGGPPAPQADSADAAVVVEAGPDPERLRRRLLSLLQGPGDPAPQIIIVGLGPGREFVPPGPPLDQARVIRFSNERPGGCLPAVLESARAARLAFLPAASTLCPPRWDALRDDSPSLMPWLADTPPPDVHAEEYPDCDTGWAATRALLQGLPDLGPPGEWGLANVAAAARRAGRAVRWVSAPARPAPPAPAPGSAPVLKHGSSVAALIPHYRCERWLAECLESLVMQSRPPDAVVVIDDASDAPPADIVRRFPSVTLLRAASNVGPYRLIQQVIDETAYDAYLFQDADDWSAADRLELLLREAERTGAELIGSHELRSLGDGGGRLPVCYPLDVNAALAEWPAHPLLHPTSLTSRALVRRLGGFATGLRFGADTEFLRRAAHVARVVNLNYFSYFRRDRPGSLMTAPETGLGSPARSRLQETLDELAHQNAAAVARGQAPSLKPLATGPAVRLTHVRGPELKAARRGR